ncbi:acyl-CoA dehydrogenase family protein [Nocardioides sp. TF02-7]|uniref:acyl-CoA dehydrogenase family protein n=1 Tax=Nocardioides sp. TF02-7 TaxID=2917724 RepID=UPI001F065354|nr:acyl-CoA dehydrogenase family protein [Nocardioides sp. TF02-7]UMG91186.1 hypothetical protein MF408_13415 [Nocardioides sp. TF02-7]
MSTRPDGSRSTPVRGIPCPWPRPRSIAVLRTGSDGGTAALLVGVARTLVDRTVDHVRNRRAFGGTLADLQSVRHAIADAVVAVEGARAAVWAAADAANREDEAAGRWSVIAVAAAVAAGRRAGEVALQCHGAVGLTDAFDLAVWLRRGKALEIAAQAREYEERMW